MDALRCNVEEWLDLSLHDKSYGGDVTDFMLFIISLGNVNQNDKMESAYSKMGQFKDPISGKKVKYLGIGMSFIDSEIAQSEQDDLKESLLEKLRIKLELFSFNKKNGFMYKQFKEDLFALIRNK
jgi:hypothetical protein